MGLPLLDNLVRIGRLKAEPRSDAEVREPSPQPSSRL